MDNEWPACSKCRFFDTASELAGSCRRHAPTRMRIDVVGRKQARDEDETFVDLSEGVWPRVMSDDWCGEFEPYQEPPA